MPSNENIPHDEESDNRFAPAVHFSIFDDASLCSKLVQTNALPKLRRHWCHGRAVQTDQWATCGSIGLHFSLDDNDADHVSNKLQPKTHEVMTQWLASDVLAE